MKKTTAQEVCTCHFVRLCRNTGYSVLVVNFRTRTGIITRTFGGDTEYKIAKLRNIADNRVAMDIGEEVDLDNASFKLLAE